jgi:nicotinamide-nucleotide amidase
VLETGTCVAVALPGPPNELRRLWAKALETEPLRGLLARARPPERRTLRFFGVSESAVARALDDAGGEQSGVEATVCARNFEVHVDLVGGGKELDETLRRELAEYLFAEDERPVAEIVLELCRARGFTLATAESCTGGLVAELLTRIPGSSEVFVGAVVAYSNELKVEQLGVPLAMLEEHGAVSQEVARAMADGARERLGADVAVAVTGIAGPGGGTPEKPVGTVHIEAAFPGAYGGSHFVLPGDRDVIRARAAASALHLIRQVVETLE